MSISMYQASVPVFSNMLGALSKVLAKGEANILERNIDAGVIISSRLAPDMLPRKNQIQIASDHAKFAPSRLAGRDAPRFEDNEQTFAELQARIAKTVDYLGTFAAADLDGSEDKAIQLKSATRERNFTGLDYLQRFALPNFFFHVTTAYDILRHNGVPLSKTDFLGA
jgi:uncharacterized protein